jgi:hypothetical protein
VIESKNAQVQEMRGEFGSHRQPKFPLKIRFEKNKEVCVMPDFVRIEKSVQNSMAPWIWVEWVELISKNKMEH